MPAGNVRDWRKVEEGFSPQNWLPLRNAVIVLGSTWLQRWTWMLPTLTLQKCYPAPPTRGSSQCYWLQSIVFTTISEAIYPRVRFNPLHRLLPRLLPRFRCVVEVLSEAILHRFLMVNDNALYQDTSCGRMKTAFWDGVQCITKEIRSAS